MISIGQLRLFSTDDARICGELLPSTDLMLCTSTQSGAICFFKNKQYENNVKTHLFRVKNFKQLLFFTVQNFSSPVSALEADVGSVLRQRRAIREAWGRAAEATNIALHLKL
jgi:hypothetical protein